MMQTLPFVAAKTSTVKNPVEPEVSKQPDVKGASFNQVLSKQMAQEDAKKLSNKTNDKLIQQRAEKKSADEAIADIAKKTARGKEDSVDAQLLALEVTAKTLEEVTEGKVILDVQATDVQVKDVAQTGADTQLAIQAPIAAPVIQSALIQPPVLQANSATESNVDNEGPDLLDKNPLGEIAETAAAKTKDSAEFAQQKVSSSSDRQQLENDQFVQTMIAESKMKAGQETAVTKAMPNVAETSTIATVSLQPAAKFTSTPIPTARDNQINAYPGKAGWNEAVSQKVVWMVGATEQSATLTLNPPELGPLEVIINVNNEKADATFISENPEVRKALEEGVSTLRQLMGQAGVELGQANVSTSKQQQEFQQASREQLTRQQAANSSQQPEESGMIRASMVRETNGLVDIFA